MIPVLKNFLKLLAVGYALFFAAAIFGTLVGETQFFAISGLFLALVPIMVGLLQIWDRFIEVTNACWLCGRDQVSSRLMHLSDWYKRGENDDGKCGNCGRKLVQCGDRVYGASVGAKAA